MSGSYLLLLNTVDTDTQKNIQKLDQLLKTFEIEKF